MAEKIKPINRSASGNLVSKVINELRQSIQSGAFGPGSKLPSEAQLTAQFGVSRTVVREAIAALRADGLVEGRQGSGVFVLEAPRPEALPFQNIDYDRVSSVIEILELRTGVEVEAAGLAALRRSPQQEETIIGCHERVLACMKEGKTTAEADFALHLAIADASNNPRFAEFLSMIGSGVIPRAALQPGPDASTQDYIARLHNEHAQIVEAVLNGNEEGAREAMRLHLKGSQNRYRNLLRRNRDNL
ncbi:FadR/GntR family transcriptional regulator [Brucellaceae bacterium D45D]